MKDLLKTIGMILLIVAVFAGLFRLDFIIWRAEHPTAPAWTWWLHSK